MTGLDIAAGHEPTAYERLVTRTGRALALLVALLVLRGPCRALVLPVALITVVLDRLGYALDRAITAVPTAPAVRLVRVSAGHEGVAA